MFLNGLSLATLCRFRSPQYSVDHGSCMFHQSARRELERQRQLEWERQRRDQLVAEKQREQNQVDRLQANVGKLKLELEALVSCI